MMINYKNSIWLKNSVIAFAFSFLLSCSHASHKEAPVGASRLIPETCSQKLDKEINNPSSGVGGTVVVNIQVDKLGKASLVKIVQSSNIPKIDTAVINFYEQCTYTVAKINGRAVRGTTMQGYTYYL